MGRLAYVVSFGAIVYYGWQWALMITMIGISTGPFSDFMPAGSELRDLSLLAGVIAWLWATHKVCWWIKGGFEKNEK